MNSKSWNSDEIERPLVNRATQGLYPPGSTFKVVTAAAGLDSGTITPESTINAPGTLEVEGTPLQNDFNEDFGAIGLDTALTNSVNTWFGQLGQQLGNDTLFQYMERFGFNATPAIDLPEDEVEESGVWDIEQNEILTAERPRRPRPPRDRAGAAAGDAAADGAGGGGGGQRRQADEAADLEAGGRPRRPRRPTPWTPPSTASRSARRRPQS